MSGARVLNRSSIERLRSWEKPEVLDENYEHVGELLLSHIIESIDEALGPDRELIGLEFGESSSDDVLSVTAVLADGEMIDVSVDMSGNGEEGETEAG